MLLELGRGMPICIFLVCKLTSWGFFLIKLYKDTKFYPQYNVDCRTEFGTSSCYKLGENIDAST
jgi:hypothetical protein